MRSEPDARTSAAAERHRLQAEAVPGEDAPRPSPQFRRRAWQDFQRAIDPLATPKPLPQPRQH
jgi:hypothetical protein